MKKPNFVNVIFSKGKAYVPVFTEIEGGGSLITDVVATKSLGPEALIDAIKTSLKKSAKNKTIPFPSKEEMKEYWKNDPILKVTKSRNWSHLAKTSASYGIIWNPNETILFLHTLDKKGRFAPTHESRKKALPTNEPLNLILEEMLRDLKKFPYAFDE